MNNEELSISTPISDLSERLLTENDYKEFENITKLFNINLKKRTLIRAAALNDLQDQITNQMRIRLDKKSDEFSNQDLVSYFKVIQDSLAKQDLNLDEANRPVINIKNNQVNINLEENALNRDQRENVMDTVKLILERYGSVQDNIIDVLEDTEDGRSPTVE